MTSRIHSLRSTFFLLTIMTLFFPLLATAAEVRIGGTGNALGTMHLLGDAFMRIYPDTKITILGSIGTSGALKAVPKGAIEIGLSSRLLNDEETANGLSATEYARSPTVFAVAEKTKVTAITRHQIADIYAGKMITWSTGGAVRLVMRQPGDDNTRQIKGLSPEIEKAVVAAEQRQGLAFAVTDQEAADKMEAIPDSLGVTTLALIKSEKRGLRALTLDGVAPTTENIQSGSYPLVKHFYLVLPKTPSASALEFVKFVRSAKGGEILKQTGHVLP